MILYSWSRSLLNSFLRIIVGVKYCFRYNQRNRQARLLADGEQIDMGAMPRPHRRRREKKLMTMDEVNERFPLTKYKTWRALREHEGLPTAGGIAGSRAASLRDAEGILEGKTSEEAARPETAIAQAQQDHAHATSPAPATTDDTGLKSPVPADVAKTGEAKEHYGPGQLEKTTTADSVHDAKQAPQPATVEDDDEDDDDPIRTAAPPEMLAAPGDSCAICLDTLEDDDDVRGLTCGHAFHAACVDPWLTGRRACCPLCKADYYVPKPRSEGEEQQQQQEAAQMRRPAVGTFGGLRLPGAPAQARTRNGQGRRMMIVPAGAARFFGDQGAQAGQQHPRGNPPTLSSRDGAPSQGWRGLIPSMGRRSVPEQSSAAGPVTTPSPSNSPPRSWGSSLFSRSNRQQQPQPSAAQPEVTPSALEEGRR